MSETKELLIDGVRIGTVVASGYSGACEELMIETPTIRRVEPGRVFRKPLTMKVEGDVSSIVTWAQEVCDDMALREEARRMALPSNTKQVVVRYPNGSGYVYGYAYPTQVLTDGHRLARLAFGFGAMKFVNDVSQFLVTASDREKPDPIPLATPDGEVLAWACGLCRRVPTGVSVTGLPDAEDRRWMADHAKSAASSCCVCHKCKRVEVGCGLNCKACNEKQRAVWEALEAEETARSERQVAVDSARRQLEWVSCPYGPIATIATARYSGAYEGAKWVAFSGLPTDLDPDAFGDDTDAAAFWTSEAANYVGRGATPEAAFANLREIAVVEAILRLLTWLVAVDSA